MKKYQTPKLQKTAISIIDIIQASGMLQYNQDGDMGLELDWNKDGK